MGNHGCHRFQYRDRTERGQPLRGVGEGDAIVDVPLIEERAHDVPAGVVDGDAEHRETGFTVWMSRLPRTSCLH